MDSKFNFPEIYRKYMVRGYFDISKFSAKDDFSNQYVWFYDMEWMTKDSILNFEYEEGQDQSVIPFAETGGGDYWAWYNQKSLDEDPVLFCPSGDDEVSFYAPTFIAAMFRHIFDFASQNNFCVDDCETWEMDLALARQHIKRWEEMFSSDMPEEWRNEIKNLQRRGLSLYSEGGGQTSSYEVLINPEEANDLVKRYLNYDKYDQTFSWFEQGNVG